MTDSFTLPTYQAPQPNAAQATPVAPASAAAVAPGATQPTTSTTAPQPSATDRLEALLRQLQEEQVDATTAPADSTSSAGASKQDFASALSRVPVTAVTEPSDVVMPLAGSLDEVIKTIGEQFEMGQPSLSQLLQLAKQSKMSQGSAQSSSSVASADLGVSASAVSDSVATTPSPLQFSRPHNGLSQAPMMASTPKITVMPAVDELKSTESAPVMPAAPTIPTTTPDLVAAPTPVVPTTPVAPVVTAAAPTQSTEESEPMPRILNRYLRNLSNHLKQHGQLHLPSYTRLTPAR